jgi:hypothetical protein
VGLSTTRAQVTDGVAMPLLARSEELEIRDGAVPVRR